MLAALRAAGGPAPAAAGAVGQLKLEPSQLQQQWLRRPTAPLTMPLKLQLQRVVGLGVTVSAQGYRQHIYLFICTLRTGEANGSRQPPTAKRQQPPTASEVLCISRQP